MDSREPLDQFKEQIEISKMKIDCSTIKQLIRKHFEEENEKHRQSNMLNGNVPSTSEVHEKVIFVESMLLNIRTYFCSHGKCKLQHNRSHRRISMYNWKKMLKNNTNLAEIISLAHTILTSNRKQQTKDKLNTKKHMNYSKQKNNRIMGCVFCLNPKLKGTKHIHFIKGEQIINTDNNLKIPCEPIEEVFTQIDKKAEKNKKRILTRKCPDPPGNIIHQNNTYRMSYGDLNYLGNNKALLYFDRGVRGKQIFTNSVHPISKQPKSLDTIVVDGIVFTSTCKCDSTNLHREMFPHYRVTCAVGLTCPARLNNFEKEIYKRSRNASTEMYTKASSMLIRYWR